MDMDVRHAIRILIAIYEKTVNNEDLSNELGFGHLAMSRGIGNIIKLLLDLDYSNRRLIYQNNLQENDLKEYSELFKYDYEWYSEEQKKAIKEFIAQYVDEDEDD